MIQCICGSLDLEGDGENLEPHAEMICKDCDRIIKVPYQDYMDFYGEDHNIMKILSVDRFNVVDRKMFHK